MIFNIFWSMNTLHSIGGSIGAFRVSLLVIEEGMIPNDSLHCATVLWSGSTKLKCVCSTVYVQSLHVIVNFPKTQHSGTSGGLLPQSDLIKRDESKGNIS